MDNPNGRPQMIETTDAEGKKKWDDTAQMKFYEDLVAKTNETLYRLHGLPVRLRSASSASPDTDESFQTHNNFEHSETFEAESGKGDDFPF